MLKLTQVIGLAYDLLETIFHVNPSLKAQGHYCETESAGVSEDGVLARPAGGDKWKYHPNSSFISKIYISDIQRAGEGQVCYLCDLPGSGEEDAPEML